MTRCRCGYGQAPGMMTNIFRVRLRSELSYVSGEGEGRPVLLLFRGRSGVPRVVNRRGRDPKGMRNGQAQDKDGQMSALVVVCMSESRLKRVVCLQIGTRQRPLVPLCCLDITLSRTHTYNAFLGSKVVWSVPPDLNVQRASRLNVGKRPFRKSQNPQLWPIINSATKEA